MDKKWYSAECLGDSVIALGKAGEGEAVRIEIDVSEWAAAYPYAQIKLFVKPPKPGAPYFARIDGPEDGVIGWTLKKRDTQHAGGGVIELMLISGEEVLLKSATARTELLPSPSMGGAADNPPEANEAWWEEALEKIDEAKQEAIQSVGALAGEATSAAERAETAAAKAEAASEHIDETVTDLRHDIDALADTMALLHAGVPDTSAKAASHELYATDAPMQVTLFGQTTETGTGEKSPDNPYTISGVSAAQIMAGGNNLIRFVPETKTINGITMTAREDGSVVIESGGSPTKTGSIQFDLQNPIVVRRGMILYNDNHSGWIAIALRDPSDTTIIKDLVGIQHRKNSSKIGDTIPGLTIGRISIYSAPTSVFQDGETIDFFINADSSDVFEPSKPINDAILPLLPNGEALYGDGTVMDTIENDVLVDGERKCRVTRRWNTITLTGEENFTTTDTGTETQMFRIPVKKAPLSPKTNTVPIKCTEYKFAAWSSQPWRTDLSVSYDNSGLRIKDMRFADAAAFKAHVAERYAAGNPIVISYPMNAEEVYVTEPAELRKPSGMMPVTVTGSGETEVAYAHDTKHYIDSQIAAVVALAMNS